MTADGAHGSQLELAVDLVGDPSWAPDGHRLAFAKVDGDEVALYTVAADGTESQRVAIVEGRRLDGAAVSRPTFAWIMVAWSPDGTRLLYTCGAQVCVVRTDGTPVGQSPVSLPNGSLAAWSPDSTRIAVGSVGLNRSSTSVRSGGEVVLYTMAPDGTDERILVVADPYARETVDCGRGSGTSVNVERPADATAPVNPGTGDPTLEPPACDAIPDPGSTAPSSLGQPTNLHVRPFQNRRAILSWNPVPSAAKYVVQIRQRTSTGWGDWLPPDRRTGETASGDVVHNCYLVSLDRVIRPTSGSSEGLADSVAYGLRLRAVNGTVESAVSSEAIIIDSPIIEANGKSTAGAPQVTLTWRSIGDILGSDYSTGTYAFHHRAPRRQSPGAWLGARYVRSGAGLLPVLNQPRHDG